MLRDSNQRPPDKHASGVRYNCATSTITRARTILSYYNNLELLLCFMKIFNNKNSAFASLLRNFKKYSILVYYNFV